jgi:hypothetical protein
MVDIGQRLVELEPGTVKDGHPFAHYALESLTEMDYSHRTWPTARMGI